jgi:hypothetical protein
MLGDDIPSRLSAPGECEYHFVGVKQCANLNQPLAGAGSHGLTDCAPSHFPANNVKGLGVSVFVVFPGQMSTCGIGFIMALDQT